MKIYLSGDWTPIKIRLDCQEEYDQLLKILDRFSKGQYIHTVVSHGNNKNIAIQKHEQDFAKKIADEILESFKHAQWDREHTVRED